MKQAHGWWQKKLDIPLVQLYDILTFYAMLETKPRGRYIIGGVQQRSVLYF